MHVYANMYHATSFRMTLLLISKLNLSRLLWLRIMQTAKGRDFQNVCVHMHV
jgi:hypothetical protein